MTCFWLAIKNIIALAIGAVFLFMLVEFVMCEVKEKLGREK